MAKTLAVSVSVSWSRSKPHADHDDIVLQTSKSRVATTGKMFLIPLMHASENLSSLSAITQSTQPSTSARYQKRANWTELSKVLRPTRHKIGHFINVRLENGAAAVAGTALDFSTISGEEVQTQDDAQWQTLSICILTNTVYQVCMYTWYTVFVRSFHVLTVYVGQHRRTAGPNISPNNRRQVAQKTAKREEN